jgi:hypothetical protein
MPETDGGVGMGFFSAIAASWRKSRALRAVSTVLGQVPKDLSSMMKLRQEQAAALDQLIDLVQSDPQLSDVLLRFDAGPTDLRTAYSRLNAVGAGQWAAGHWVPASALAYSVPLTLVLETLTADAPRDEWVSVSARVVRYFNSRATTQI